MSYVLSPVTLQMEAGDEIPGPLGNAPTEMAGPSTSAPRAHGPAGSGRVTGHPQ